MRNLSLLLISLLMLALSGCLGRQQPTAAASDSALPVVRIRQLTSGPWHHFASAYYHIRSWDESGRWLLCLRTDIVDRNPEPGDVATVGMIDCETGGFRPIAETCAWNFQQGTMQQWLGSAPDSLVIFNDLRDGRFVAVIMNAFTGELVRTVPRPVSAVSHDGRRAVSFNFARLHRTRPGYGYAGSGQEARLDESHPVDDGLFLVDLESGESKLIVSLDSVFDYNPPPDTDSERPFWFNHTLFSRDDSRIFFLGRYPRQGGGWYTSSYTIGAEGDSLRRVLGYGRGGSHFDWLSGNRLMVTCFYGGASGPLAHLLFNDTPDEEYRDYRVLGEGMLAGDGHGRFSQDGCWMVTDTYPVARRRSLMLMRMSDDAMLRLGAFEDHSETYKGPWRCDLHPAFDIPGRRIVFDSVNDGTRQVYIAELQFNN